MEWVPYFQTTMLKFRELDRTFQEILEAGHVLILYGAT